jgi:two-component system NarL family sensor kinase
LRLSEKLNFTRGIIRYYSCQGEVLNMNGKYAECLSMLMRGLSVSRQRKDHMREGIMCENIGNTFALLEKLDSAIQYYYLALPIFESFNDTIKISIVYNDLSSIYIRTEKTEKALEFANKALRILQKNKNEFYLAGLINKESILWKLKHYEEAAAVNTELIAEAARQQDDESLYNALQNQ